jgi:hypothetical protein
MINSDDRDPEGKLAVQGNHGPVRQIDGPNLLDRYAAVRFNMRTDRVVNGYQFRR